jgi:hypothetical protein
VQKKDSSWFTYLDLCEEFPELRYVLKETFDRVVEKLGTSGVQVTKAERYVESVFRLISGRIL